MNDDEFFEHPHPLWARGARFGAHAGREHDALDAEHDALDTEHDALDANTTLWTRNTTLWTRNTTFGRETRPWTRTRTLAAELWREHDFDAKHSLI